MSNKLGMLFPAVVGIFFHRRHRWHRPATCLEGGASPDGTGDTGYPALRGRVGWRCEHTAVAMDAPGSTGVPRAPTATAWLPLQSPQVRGKSQAGSGWCWAKPLHGHRCVGFLYFNHFNI